MLSRQFKHLDLREIAERIEPARQETSKRGRTYQTTEPGRADFAAFGAVLALKSLWADGARMVRLDEVEQMPEVQRTPEGASRLAASLKRLARIKQVKLDFDRDGVKIEPGTAWIET